MMGVLQKLMPARAQAQEPSMIIDLDDLMSKPVAFRYKGVLYTVQPVSTRTFLELSDNLAKAGHLLTLQKLGEAVTQSQIYEAYHRFISVLVPDFSIKTLEKMAIPQVHA